ncbi:MAG: VOC family protein [Cytophaga sp.]|uniref:VOC family protein n=1 Tax=Cytophaga sp. TaxID=29535 RepID=UPI003F810CE9
MNNNMYPCLWFDTQAKAAADYYCSIFKNSKITSENPVVVNFELNGNKFIALNGGPAYKFSPATSFVIECDTQEEIDYYWEKLGKDGRYDRCGWLDDKYGITWQVIPSVLPKLMSDPQRSQRVVDAFMKMSKFDIQTLLDA